MTAILERHSGRTSVIMTGDASGDGTWGLSDPVTTVGREHAFITRSGRVRVRMRPVARVQRETMFGKLDYGSYGDSGFNLIGAPGAESGLLIETKHAADGGWTTYTSFAAVAHLDVNIDVGMHSYVRATLVGPTGLMSVELTESLAVTANTASLPDIEPPLPPLPQIEFSDIPAFDAGTSPQTPIYIRNTWDEVAGAWATEYSVDGSDWTYVPVGAVVFSDKRIHLGSQSVAVGALLVPPAGANVAEIGAWGVANDHKEALVYRTDAVVPTSGAAKAPISLPGRLELESADEIAGFRSAMLAGASGTLHVEYFYVPQAGNN